MEHRKSLEYVLLTLLLVVGMAVPAAAVSPADDRAVPDENAASVAATAAKKDATQNESSVSVTVGQQLSTVIGVSSDEVQTDFGNAAFDASVEAGDEDERAEAIADRAEELRERAEDIREEYEEATERYENGEISKSEYARQLATLNARATNLLGSYERLTQQARNVSALERRAAGVNQTALRTAVENLNTVSGAGPAALLEQFTGQSRGEIELETADGLRIEITSEDGEQSREFERPRDDDRSITVGQSTALETARAELSTPENGSWTLTEASVKRGEGAYEFEFVLRGVANRTGEAEVSVDGSSGEVFELEEEIRTRKNGDEDEAEDRDEDEDDREDGELAVLIAAGTPAPNETVTIKVLSNGASAESATVSLNDRVVGTTGADGTVRVTLPASGDVELTAQKGESEGELEFEFDEDEDEGEELFRKLNVDTTLADDTVSVSVTYDGSGVRNATVYANGRAVGTTDSAGTVTFTVDANATEELELEVVKGAFEAELEYTVQSGSLTLTEKPHEGDGDKVADEADDDEANDDEADDQETENDEDGSDGENTSREDDEDDEPERDEDDE